MRKTIFSLLIFLLVIMFCACSTNTGKSHDSSSSDAVTCTDDWDGLDGVFLPQLRGDSFMKLYGDELYCMDNGVFFRLNVKTGLRTDVCTDPLCTHDTENCPFYGLWTYFIDGDTVWFTAETKNYDSSATRRKSKKCICTYDIRTQKRTLIYEIPDDGTGYHLLGIFDGYLYYVRSQYRENVTAAKSEADYIRYYCRCEPKKIGNSKQEEIILTLKNEKQGDYSDVYYMTETEVFLRAAGEEKILIRADRKLTEFETLQFEDYNISTARIGNYAYYLKCGDEALEYVTDTDGKGKPVMNEDGTPKLIPLYGLYYTKRDLITGEDTRLSDDILFIRHTGGMIDSLTRDYLYLELENGLWRCDHDGNKLQLVLTKEQEAENPVNSGLPYQLIIGKYIYTIEKNSGRISRFDMESGKYDLNIE